MKMTPENVNEFFKRLQELNPNPRCELEFTSPYTLMVAIILSAQATDKGVNKATPALFAKADNPSAMLELGETGLKEYIKTIGLYNNKAKNIIAMSKMLAEKFAGKLPREREILETLPGVGRKSANVFLNVIYNEPRLAVDTHVFRVSNRTGLASGKTPLEVEEKLEKVVPEKYKCGASHWLVLHGRYICTAKNPKCAECPVADLCAWLP